MSRVLFISRQDFIDRVVNDLNTEMDLKLENCLRNYLIQLRHEQNSKTVWDGRLAGKLVNLPELNTQKEEGGKKQTELEKA